MNVPMVRGIILLLTPSDECLRRLRAVTFRRSRVFGRLFDDLGVGQVQMVGNVQVAAEIDEDFEIADAGDIQVQVLRANRTRGRPTPAASCRRR